MAFISIFTLITCLLLIGVVLIQNSKGGGLSSQFSASNQVMGVRKTADFLEKATWFLAIMLLVLSLASAAMIERDDENTPKESVTKDMIQQQPVQAPAGGPVAPGATPVPTQQGAPSQAPSQAPPAQTPPANGGTPPSQQGS